VNWTRGNRFGLALLAASAAAAGLSACASMGGGETDGGQGPQAACVGPQCWSPQEQYLWYRGSQGSRLVPEAWLRALEAPNSAVLFLDPAHFDQFGYLPADNEGIPPATASRRKCPTVPAGLPKLPIGFARDCQSDGKLIITKLRWYKGQGKKESWVGLNCAACHTTDITYKGNKVRVDGAPTLADFQGFTDALRVAMDRTLADPAKWDRFARRVVAPRRPKEKDDSRVLADEAMLKDAFKKLLDHQVAVHAYNETETDYGHGRLDAVGHILNQVAFNNAIRGQFRGEPDAPVSYPFIWNARQHDFLQWNGIVPTLQPFGPTNVDVGAVVRNTSEVIGVFAELTTKRDVWIGGFRSSVDVKNLLAMEGLLGKLWSPAWPDWLPAPDPDKVRAGEALFNSRERHPESCADCHAKLARGDQTTPIKAVMSPVWGTRPVGTDPWMMCNAFSYVAKAGNLEGTKDKIVVGDPLPATGPTHNFLGTQAIGVLLAHKWQLIWAVIKQGITRKPPPIEVFEPEAGVPTPQEQPRTREERLQQCKDATASPGTSAGSRRILAYKGRPLNGIWSTAPYLHNGSVKSLFELMLPEGKRDPQFWVGNHEIDPVNVGFVDGKSAEYPYGSMFDVNDPKSRGNSNAGHDYANERYTDAERMALVEYMKTL
jgi:mono/diheme cytochrome c family protein